MQIKMFRRSFTFFTLFLVLASLANGQQDVVENMDVSADAQMNEKQQCYSDGPLLPKYMMTSASEQAERSKVGTVSCTEVVGYMKGLGRYYERKCVRKGPACEVELQYAVNWFKKVTSAMATECKTSNCMKL
ncbi:uncharacterized protein LOC129743627 [Uranotaenia lowii]|uniref:uncharacterized protein LOC129743627 n=1 Tax=Uranotaenia lowii TaxID=190385 RepID=UPI002479E3FF|nr:uncharacterized protein LOC129743627 [Uranotaenia lowii]